MKVFLRLSLALLLTLPLAACSPETGSLNKNQDPADESLLKEHDENSNELPADDPPP